MDMLALLTAQVNAEADTLASTELVLGGQSVTLKASALTAQDMTVLKRKHPDFMSNPSMEGMVDLLIRKARLADGEKAFTLEHKPLLMRLALNLVSGAFGELFGEQLVADEPEVLEGNS